MQNKPNTAYKCKNALIDTCRLFRYNGLSHTYRKLKEVLVIENIYQAHFLEENCVSINGVSAHFKKSHHFSHPIANALLSIDAKR